MQSVRGAYVFGLMAYDRQDGRMIAVMAGWPDAGQMAGRWPDGRTMAGWPDDGPMAR